MFNPLADPTTKQKFNGGKGEGCTCRAIDIPSKSADVNNFKEIIKCMVTSG